MRAAARAWIIAIVSSLIFAGIISLTRALDGLSEPRTIVNVADNSDVETEFDAFIRRIDFPCVGAKAALAAGSIETITARDITSSWDDLRIHEHLCAFSKKLRDDSRSFRSFAVLFEQPHALDELVFEKIMWTRLQSIQDKDHWLSYRPDARVARDPNSPDFAFSVGGEAYFVVGMHPGSSRQSRRTPMHALIFNPFMQFQQLREAGKYSRMSDVVRSRDIAVCGSENPMLADHGTAPVARQFSGRTVGEDWRCPLRPAGTTAA
jgi:FPC/CPF motif-containing protein YcgG